MTALNVAIEKTDSQRYPQLLCRIIPVDAPNLTAGSSEPAKIGYPNSACNKSGHQTVQEDPLRRIYGEKYGSADGEPVMFLHGGPGAGCHKFHAHFFDPERYRVILFDQRGCGKSTPSASDDDATAALTDNTTAQIGRALR